LNFNITNPEVYGLQLQTTLSILGDRFDSKSHSIFLYE
jgi:hypothetical protein